MTPDERTAEIGTRKRPVREDGKDVQHKIWIRDGWTYRPVYEVPIECLVLNVDNKRFTSEKEMVEHVLGRPLDPTNNATDELSIISILCDSSVDVDHEEGVASGTPSKDYLALRDDFADRGQAEPLWIRPDGTVRNGNRRLAMLKRRRQEGADVNYVEAIILPIHDVDEPELFRMEQREQLAENFKKRYQDVNALLALKDAAELEGIDWDDPDSIAAVAARLKHQAGRDVAGYASKQLYAIKALEAYLNYIDAPERYSLAHKKVEVFREVGLCMSQFVEEPAEQFTLLQAAFAFVQAGRGYEDIRQLRNLFINDRALFDRMHTSISEAEDDSGWDSETADSEVEYPELADATAPDPDENEDEDEDEGTEGVAGPSRYPRQAVGAVIETALDRHRASSLDVHRQLDQARVRLDAVDLTALGSLNSDDRERAREAVTAIRDLTEAALAALTKTNE